MKLVPEGDDVLVELIAFEHDVVDVVVLVELFVEVEVGVAGGT